MSILEICAWFETTSLGAIARESLYGFQVLVGIHILGLIFSVGMLLWVDLRMLGTSLLSAGTETVYRNLSPIFLAGFAIMLGSGFALFAGFATSAYENSYFRIKIAAMALAGANALAYHLIANRKRTEAGGAARTPASVRAAGLVSLLLWGTVILCGRMMSYTMF